MKRRIALLLAMILCLSLEACSKNTNPESSNTVSQEETTISQEGSTAVSYTHLDVYKRQRSTFERRDIKARVYLNLLLEG